MTEVLFVLILTVLAVFLAGFIFHRWQYGLFLIFIWLYLEDIIRRLIPGQPVQVMLIKDALLFLTYISFFATVKKLWKPPFVVALLVFSAILSVNALNLNSPRLLFGIIGLRSYLWYTPLLFLGYHMFKREDALLKFCRILVYTSIPLFIFAVVQYIFFDSAFVLIRPFEMGHQIRSFDWVDAGSVKRISSVFGEAQRYAAFSMFLFFLGLAIYATSQNNKLLRTSTICAFLGVIISSSRSAFALSIIGFILFFMLTTPMGLQVRKGFRSCIAGRIIAVSLVLLAVLPVGLLAIYKFGGDIGLLQVSTFNFALTERIPRFFREIGGILSSELNFWGYGTGTMSQGLRSIPGGVEWYEYQKGLRGGVWFESGISKIIFELGILGLGFFYLFWGHLVYSIRKELKTSNSSNLRNIGVSVYIFILLILIRFSFVHHQVLGDATVLVVLWFFIGVLFNLKSLVYEIT